MPQTPAPTRSSAAATLEIVPYAPSLRPHFECLNREWLTRWFEVEPIDARVLGDPQTHILDRGGSILFALLDGEPVGCVALLPDAAAAGHYELTKMAVTARCQGLGVGRRLLAAAIAAFQRLGGRQLFLESHSSLQAALHLYAQAGFELQPGPRPGSHYARSDTYMIWRNAGGHAAG